MPNLLQQRTVAETVTQYTELLGLQPHKSFLYLIIEKYLHNLDLNTIDIEESIVDGSNDCGIDAIVIDEESELRPHIYFFQSKYYLSDNAFERTFDGNELDKIKSAVNDFVLEGKINSRYQNERLVDKLHSVKNLSSRNPRYTLVFCSNSKGPSLEAKTRLEDFVTSVNRTAAGEYLATAYIDLDYIAQELLAPQQTIKIDFELQISGKYLTEDTGDVRLFVGAVDAKDLVTLVESFGDDLFERNVRGYLKQNNQINKNILRSASGDQSPYFVYMNNGLTITCEKFTFTPLQNSPKLIISNGQIVNGQQTARSLNEAYRTNTLKDDTKVLVRIVETTKPDLLMQIVEATNSQTRVTSRDLHSNDEIQKLIERYMLAKGYYYEARKNKYKNKEASKRVDAEVAAQAYYAVYFEQPAVAKDKKKLLFGDKYEELFCESTDPSDILYSYLLLRSVQMLNTDPSNLEKFTFLSDATLHTAALVHRVAKAEGLRLTLTTDVAPIYVRVTNAIDKLVKERVKEEGEKYEHRRTFKDPETYGRIAEILLNK